MSFDSQKFIGAFKKNPGLVFAGAAIFVILAVIYFRYDEIGSHEARLAEMQQNLAKLQRNVVNSAQLERQLAEIRKINEEIASTVLRPAELARNLQYFYTLESDHGVKLLDLQQQAVVAPVRGAAASIYAPMRFTVNVAGDYEQLLKLMRQVEKTFLGGKVLSAVISPGVATGGNDQTKARLLSMTVQTIALR